jgi:hypothetical protein
MNDKIKTLFQEAVGKIKSLSGIPTVELVVITFNSDDYAGKEWTVEAYERQKSEVIKSVFKSMPQLPKDIQEKLKDVTFMYLENEFPNEYEITSTSDSHGELSIDIATGDIDCDLEVEVTTYDSYSKFDNFLDK